MQHIKIILKPRMYDNLQYFRPERQRLPLVESSVERVERILQGHYSKQSEKLTHNGELITMHIDAPLITPSLINLIRGLLVEQVILNYVLDTAV